MNIGKFYHLCIVYRSIIALASSPEWYCSILFTKMNATTLLTCKREFRLTIKGSFLRYICEKKETIVQNNNLKKRFYIQFCRKEKKRDPFKKKSRSTIEFHFDLTNLNKCIISALYVLVIVIYRCNVLFLLYTIVFFYKRLFLLILSSFLLVSVCLVLEYCIHTYTGAMNFSG